MVTVLMSSVDLNCQCSQGLMLYAKDDHLLMKGVLIYAKN